MTITVKKWGNSLGVRIPRSAAQQAGLAEGSKLEVAVEAGALVLTPAEVPSLEELLSTVRPGSRPELADWGRPVGKEAW